MRAKLQLLGALGVVACAARPAETPSPAIGERRPPAASPNPSASSAPVASGDAVSPFTPPETVDGPGRAEVDAPRGPRQPLELVGSLLDPTPARELPAGFSTYTVVGAGPQQTRSFSLLLEPQRLLPFDVGERLLVNIDCRKGGWDRACDAVIRDDRQRLRLAVAGSGDPDLVRGLRVERGPVGTSETLRAEPPVIRHTHALEFRWGKVRVTAMPLVWTALDTAAGRHWVMGYETRWEGTPPPEARAERRWALVRRR